MNVLLQLVLAVYAACLALFAVLVALCPSLDDKNKLKNDEASVSRMERLTWFIYAKNFTNYLKVASRHGVPASSIYVIDRERNLRQLTSLESEFLSELDQLRASN